MPKSGEMAPVFGSLVPARFVPFCPVPASSWANWWAMGRCIRAGRSAIVRAHNLCYSAPSYPLSSGQNAMNISNSNVLQAISDDFRKRQVWARATPIRGFDPAMWRYDAFFWIIKWTDYGDRSSTYGWELDHYPVPSALGGADDVHNLRALHYSNNARLGGLLANLLAGYPPNSR